MEVNGKLERMYTSILENKKNRKMKNIKYMYSKYTLLIGLIFIVTVSCERDPSDEVEFATFSDTAEVFIDAPIGLGSYFYFPYGPDANNPVGSKPTAWSVDEEVSYHGSASMRIDVPNSDDPEGNYAGAILRIDGSGRDLSGYDALTFWAKASQGVNIGEIGFGEDFGENKFVTNLLDVSISTQWTKYIIPLPDASKLTEERGMFRYSAGSINGLGYTFWIDELKFEKLGTIAQPQPKILNGVDEVSTSFIGATIALNGLTQTFNLESGINQTVTATPSYFTFTSSDIEVVQVSEIGVVSMLTQGTATITALLNGVKAQGSLIVEVLGQFSPASTPTLDPSQVISIFSDAYTNVPVDFYNGFYAPFQTTTSNDFEVNGDNILNYENYNFVGIEFNKNVPTINASDMTSMHLDIFVPNSFDAGSDIRVNLVDFGADASFGGGDDSSVSTLISAGSIPALVTGEWISVEFDITGLVNRNNLGQIVFDGSADTSPRPSNFYVDNIYLHN